MFTTTQQETIQKRIRDKSVVDEETQCWEWSGAIFTKETGSYAQMRYEGKLQRGHRLSYRFFVGPLKDGFVIDHKCGNTLCVNPEHLEQVTQTENMRRRKDSGLPFCKNGHKWATETTYIRPDKKRECSVCRNIRVKDFYKRNKRVDTSP